MPDTAAARRHKPLDGILSAILHYESEALEPAKGVEPFDVDASSVHSMFNDLVLLAETQGIRLPAIDLVNQAANERQHSCDLQAKARDVLKDLYR
jgi:hypothetical protein